MQIKYDKTTDTLVIDFKQEVEAVVVDGKDRVAFENDAEGKIRAITICPTRKWLPRGFLQEVEVAGQ